MDQGLKEFIDRADGGKASAGAGGSDVKITLLPESAEVEARQEGVRVRYRLKPLSELYGPGAGGAVNPKDDRRMPLFYCIEEQIAVCDADCKMTDREVLFVMENLGMNPEGSGENRLGKMIELSLRMTLSLHDYSRQEVRTACRHIARSIARRSESGGHRGYLDFIAKYFGPRRKKQPPR